MPWIRKAYKGCKVYVLVGSSNDLVLQESGLASYRYRPDDDRTYSARPDRIFDLDEVAGGEGTAPEASDATSTVDPRRLGEEGVLVYTDGASSGNPGPAGIGVVLLYRDRRKEISRFLGHRTNNFAELMAIKVALEALRHPQREIALVTDSSYCLGVLRKGNRPTKNLDLVKSVRSLLHGFSRLELVWTKGHGGQPENERADRLARMAIENGGDRVFFDGREIVVP